MWVLQDAAVARHPPAIGLREIRYDDKDEADGVQETKPETPSCHAGVLSGWDGEAYLSFHYFCMQRLPHALRSQLGETSCGLSTQPQKVALSRRRGRGDCSRPASPPSGMITGDEEEGAAGKAGPEVGRSLCQLQTSPLQLRVSLPLILLPPTLPGPLPDSVTFTGCTQTRWASVSPPAPWETRMPGTPHQMVPDSRFTWWISCPTGVFK